MRLPSLFKTPKHRRFNYKPRYYDPKRERFREVREAYEVDHKNDAEAMKARIRNGLHQSYRHKGEARKKEERARMVRIVLIFLVLSGLFILALGS